MRQNTVKRKLEAGGAAFGTMMFEFNTTGIARIAAAAGAEFAIFDMEHTGWTIETIRMLIATSRSSSLIPMVRVPASEYHFIARVLDMGAMGVMFPMVESEDQAKCIVQSVKYPPIGRRGAAFGVAHDDYEAGDLVAKIESANNETMIIAQIETTKGLENVESIAAIDGVDVLWIGQTDLSNSLGIPGQFEHVLFQEAVDRVVSAAHNKGKAAGFMAMSADEARTLYERGFRILAYSGDLWIYQQALAQGLRELRENL